MSQYISTSTTIKPNVVFETFFTKRLPSCWFIDGAACQLLLSVNKFNKTSFIIVIQMTVRLFVSCPSSVQFARTKKTFIKNEEVPEHGQSYRHRWAHEGPHQVSSGDWGKAKTLNGCISLVLRRIAKRRFICDHRFVAGCGPLPCHAGGQALHDDRHAGRHHPRRLGDHDDEFRRRVQPRGKWKGPPPCWRPSASWSPSWPSRPQRVQPRGYVGERLGKLHKALLKRFSPILMYMRQLYLWETSEPPS